MPIEDITLSHPAAQLLAAFAAPTSEAEARQQQQRAGAGFDMNGFTYSYRVSVKKKNTYLLRSICYDVSDVLVAFRIASLDDDGSVVIVWSILKKFPLPKLTNAQAARSKS